MNLTLENKIKLLLTLILLGLIYFIYLFLPGILSTSWPKARGEVFNSEIVKDMSSKGAGVTGTYILEARYRYTVNNRIYEGQKVSFSLFDTRFSSQLDAEQFVRIKLYPGRKIYVHYNPANPKESVLFPGLCWVDCAMVGFLTFLALMMFYCLKYFKNKTLKI